jgi:peroxiredoxin
MATMEIEKLKVLRALFIVPLFFLMAMGPNPSAGGKKETISPIDADKVLNNRAPDFTLKDMNGKPVTLSALKGKVVLLNFWATWCPPCKAEMPALNSLYKSLRHRGFEVIAVSTDSSLSHIKDYLSGVRLDFTIVQDDQHSVSKQYRVFSMPTTFLIDKNGMIVEKFYGEYDWNEPDIRKQVEKLL